MQTLAKQVLEHAAGAPEGTPLVAKELLHLGNRAAVDQVLSRLVQRGTLLRAGRGIYVLPVESRFGTRAPSAVKMVEGLAKPGKSGGSDPEAARQAATVRTERSHFGAVAPADMDGPRNPRPGGRSLNSSRYPPPNAWNGDASAAVTAADPMPRGKYCENDAGALHYARK